MYKRQSNPELFIGSLSVLLSIASIALALIGIYLTYYRETVERKLRRDALFKALNMDSYIKTYHEKIYKELIGKIWPEYGKELKIVIILIGFVSPIGSSILGYDLFNALPNWGEFISKSIAYSFVSSSGGLFAITALIINITFLPHKWILKLSRTTNFFVVGLAICFMLTFIIIIFSIPKEKTDILFLVILIFISVVITLLFIQYYLSKVEFQAFELQSKTHELEDKQILPRMRIFLESGELVEGKLVEFYDSDSIFIEKDGHRIAILWNKIEGISFEVKRCKLEESASEPRSSLDAIQDS